MTAGDGSVRPGAAGAPVRLIRGRHVLTSGPAGHVRDGAVAVRGDRITTVGPYRELRAEHPDAEVAGDGTGILSPSLTNIHDLYQALVCCTSVRDGHTVWVGGEPVVTGGAVCGIDLGELPAHARELAIRLATDAGLDSELAHTPAPEGDLP